ncbi:DUF177 domain-containing protein [Xinfangfangia sp. D13-10-4-6]|uniref:YceD family protein n=1 Tax=Pseudogemmobacter hezensis TaxID=2737662 RepID=UPI001555CE16|nr:YceD family protein [Pseudogemmobacter hezensis]NPD16167.1 DUF177 domain-containing protein [Pseudogemmobacter hezensis]
MADDLPADRPADKASAAKTGATEAPQYRTATLSHRKPTRFRWLPDGPARAALARDLDLPRIDQLSFVGEITPEGRADFRLTASLKAQLTQACSITLAPVPASIDEEVTRRYLADWVDPEADEYEIPEDDSQEAIPELLDIAAVACEALSLALPPWPRAEGADLGEAVFAPPGETPLTEDVLKPFAGLAALMKKDDKP